MNPEMVLERLLEQADNRLNEVLAEQQPTSMPGQVNHALQRGQWSAAIRLAIQSGVRDENRLTDLVFHARHPELQGRRIRAGERRFVQEWLDIRDRLVRPALNASPVGPTPGIPTSVSWDQQGVEYVKWLQRALNLPVTGNPDRRTISAIQRLQRKSTNRLVRMGLVGTWTERALMAAGAPASPRSSPTAVGIDCNFDTRPYLSCIKNANWKGQRISFAVRYYGWHLPKHPGRNLSRGEAEALSQLGIRCVAVWEARAKDANGYQNGFRHAERAFRLAIQCGQPSGTPIYFAVDYEPSAAERPGVLRYFEGVRDGLNKARQNSQLNPHGLHYNIGVYANRVGLDLCRAQGIVTWFWQSCSALTASGTNQFRWPGVALHQVACEKPLCHGCGSRQCEIKVDWNESDGNEGGWLVSPTANAQGELVDLSVSR